MGIVEVSVVAEDPLAPSALLAQTALVPFFVLSTGGTLLQRWYAAAAPNKNPYRLYAASNAGSLLALVAYPLVIEPLLPTTIQNRAFAKGYIALVVVLALCGWYARRGSIDLTRDSVTNVASIDDDTESAPSRKRIASWVLFAFVPSSLLLGVTNWITMDMSPTPFLWVLPLALYLGTFVVAFGKWSGVLPKWARTALMVGMLVMAAGMVARRSTTLLVVVHLVVFFGLELGLHGRLASMKPSATRLTQYFMWVSFGGALGGLFNTFLAPVVFQRVGFFIEYPLALGAGLALLGAGEKLGHWRRELIAVLGVTVSVVIAMAIRDTNAFLQLGAFLLPVAVIVMFRKSALRFGVAISIFTIVGSFLAGGKMPFVERTPFGILRIIMADDSHALLFHGTTLHGGVVGPRDAEGRDVARLYYHPNGPVGSLFQRRNEMGMAQGKVDVIGLGSGALAYYAKPGERWTYFEIDPVVVKVAQDTRYFHFLEQARAESIAHVVGDARLRLVDEPNDSVSMLVVDAFSSDAIPTHLLTEEAFALYASKLKKDGVLAVHISNRHYQLSPIVAAGGKSANLVARHWADDTSINPTTDKDDVRLPSIWVALAKQDTMVDLDLPAQWTWSEPAKQAWRDDFSNVLAALAH